MSRSSRQRRKTFENFLSRLREMLDLLPSDAEKQEAEASLQKLIEFLADLKTRLELVPTTRDVSGLRDAVQTIEQAIARAETDPALASVFGLARPAARRRESRGQSGEISAVAQAALDDLKSLPVDEIRSKLQSESYPMRTLRSVAAALGVRPTKGLRREDLAHQVAMMIANLRGYRHLRGEVRENALDEQA